MSETCFRCGPPPSDVYVADFSGGVLQLVADEDYLLDITDSDRVTYALDAVIRQFRKALSLAAALHAEENRWRIGEVVRDRPREETYADAERRVHDIMWKQETAEARERYAVRAVGLLLWMGGER